MPDRENLGTRSGLAGISEAKDGATGHWEKRSDEATSVTCAHGWPEDCAERDCFIAALLAMTLEALLVTTLVTMLIAMTLRTKPAPPSPLPYRRRGPSRVVCRSALR